MKSINQLRKLIFEAIAGQEAAIDASRMQQDMGFLNKYVLVKSKVINNARTFRFEFRTDDGSYWSYVLFVLYPNGRAKMKLETDWKVTTKDNTAGAGKDFTMVYGPFESYDEMVSELNRKLNNNPLIGGSRILQDNNDTMLDQEIVKLMKNIKEKIDDIRKLNHPSLKTLEQIYSVIKDIKEEELGKFCSDNFKGWLLKQGVIYKLQDIDKLPFYKSLESRHVVDSRFLKV